MTGNASKPASTIILLRPAESAGFEVLLTRRPKNMAFLGGMYVFPGGNVRKDDCTESIIQKCYGLSATEARQILGSGLTPSLALGHWIAAVRELYEEAGILLAKTADQKKLASDVPTGLRQAFLDQAIGFGDFLQTGGLLCDLSRVIYFSHWETPRQFSMRFDTRFFLAPLPPGQTPAMNPREVEHSLWVNPEQALMLFNRQELPMIFPTFASLRTLADFDSIESVFEQYRGSESQHAAQLVESK